MSNAQAAPQGANFDYSPVLKFYSDSIEAWKKNFDTLIAASDKLVEPKKAAENSNSTDPFTVNLAQASHLQKSSEDLFKRLIEHQIEICRFFGKRWEEYLTLPQRLHQCKSLSDVGQMQMAFMTKMMGDYAQEAKRLSEPFLAMTTKTPD